MTRVQEEVAAEQASTRDASSSSSASADAPVNEDSAAGEATDAEMERFRTIFPKEYTVKINAYLEWRNEYCLPNDDTISLPQCVQGDADNGMQNVDAQVWAWAVQKAILQTAAADFKKKNLSYKQEMSSSSLPVPNKKWNQKQSSDDTESSTFESSNAATSTTTMNLPQVVFCHHYSNSEQFHDRFSGCFCDRDGRRILHVLAARLDPKAADALTHTNVIALYLEQMFQRHDAEQRVTILLDTRPGRGWRNPPALELVGLIRHAATRLHELYPDRLHKCILYPIPRAAIFFWNMVKVFLDARVRSAITLVPGDASSTNSPLPRKQLVAQGVDEACLDHCEKIRLETFAKASRRSG